MTDPTPDIPETPDSQANALPLQAAELIADEARRAPDKPGVYRMYGEDGACLYVGKAKSLKKRVVQYAQGRFHTQRIGLMVSLTRAMELVVTASETEALLLESNFIKKLKPRFPYDSRRLLRSLRLDLGGQPHAEHASESLPAAVLFGQRL